MSYLGYPRVNFAGLFQADVSTVNNTFANFDDERFIGRFQRSGGRGRWNPRGTGAWRVRDCNVTSVLSTDGRPAGDPLTSAVVAHANDRVSAKLVDLDPAQQQVSMIFGLRLALRFPDGREGFSGAFKPAPFSDIWLRCAASPGMHGLSATYQSVIEVEQWGDESMSALLQELREATAGELLSIKFNVDGFDPVSTSPTFTWGRIVGSIGPYAAGEPHHFVAARLLATTGSGPAPAPCRIDEDTATLSLDLGNSLPTDVAGKSLIDSEVLRLVARPAGAEPVLLASTSSGHAFYDSFYTSQAGILGAKLNPAQLEAARLGPLALLNVNDDPVLVEDPDGRYLRADEFVFRMSPGDKAAVSIYATSFGQWAAGVQITTRYDTSQLGGPVAGVPESALTFPESVKTGPQGRALLELTASDPGNPRQFVDGQVYGVAYGWEGDEAVAQGNKLNALVWSAYAAPKKPTWVADVQPILQQYANLYPIMRDVVDLSNYVDVAQRHRRALMLAMDLPTTDPNYMPVTRDLSPAKRDMIVGWLKRGPHPPIFRIDDVEGLRQVLQLAIELEHATIPPYLCALFSIVPGQNQVVAELIKSVVMQEMLHMALVCNLLNGVGGHPRIASPSFAPRFPGHLPGGVRPDLTVTLRKCSIAQVRDVFMAIEAPSKPLRVPDDVPPYVDMHGIEVDRAGDVTDETRASRVAQELAMHFTRVEHEPLTIGWFYKQIGKGIVELGDGIFTGDPSLQMTPEIYTGAPGNLYTIGDTTHALLALQEIERQGEGTPGTDPTAGPRNELAHYYRFKEIVEG
ncbi:MAG TPA: ferritin-like protein, partial [Solirubrobacteraceae bacterium]